MVKDKTVHPEWNLLFRKCWNEKWRCCIKVPAVRNPKLVICKNRKVALRILSQGLLHCIGLLDIVGQSIISHLTSLWTLACIKFETTLPTRSDNFALFKDYYRKTKKQRDWIPWRMEEKIRKDELMLADPDSQGKFFGPEGSGSVIICADPDPSINKQNCNFFPLTCYL